jgi:general nucleoside transport system ATP-binding protein
MEGFLLESSIIDFNSKIIEMKNITKKFGEFTANDSINLTVHKGEVHALLGENGAGKTTLMNILYGLYTPTMGEVYIKGNLALINNPNVAISLGVGMVHQHFMLVKPFTIVENIILGKETTGFAGKIDMKKAKHEIIELSEKYGFKINPDAKIQDISVGMQQKVEILKALYRGADILILDEPTASLTPQEISELIEIIKNLAKEGKSIILITHKLKEITAISDFCTVIRRGKYMGTINVKETTENELASLMVGREVTFKVEKTPYDPKGVVFEINDLTALDYRKIEILKKLNLQVKKGEILGIAGIDGNGQSELAEVIIGIKNSTSGTIKVNDKDITNKKPAQILQEKVGCIPEDRQKHGLVLDFSVEENLVLQQFKKPKFLKGINLNKEAINKFAIEMIEKFDIRPNDSAKKPARALSGGNQQKIIIAREINNNPDILVAVNPTRGLDVGAIEFVHKYLVEQRNKGKGVLLISYELDEITALSDRINVIFEGKIVADILNDEKGVDEKELGILMAGGTKN